MSFLKKKSFKDRLGTIAKSTVPQFKDNTPQEVLEGFFETCNQDWIEGWLYDKNQPDLALEYELLSDGKVLAEGIAESFREDLFSSGIGNGKHAFRIPCPIELLDNQDHTIMIRSKTSGVQIKGSPLVLNSRMSQSAKAPANEPGFPARVVQREDGLLEMCGPRWISGWLFSLDQTNQSQQYQIYSDGVLIAEGLANEPREDLRMAGIGTGEHSFRIAVPDLLFDGQEHTIELKSKLTGVAIKGSPMTFKGEQLLKDQLQLDGTTLRGTGFLKPGMTSGGELEVIEGNHVICKGNYWEDSGHPGKIDFAVPLPPEVMDGRPHAFEIRSTEDFSSLGSAAFIMPNALIKEEVLLKYAREGMAPSFSTLAGYRYKSLSLVLEHADPLAKSTGKALPEFLEQINYVHHRLVKGANEADQKYDQLVFPKFDKPEVSIIIPLHNKFSVTYHCLLSLLLAYNESSYEVILVDDGSTDKTKEIPKIVQNITYLRNEESKGFIRTCNLGAKSAKGDYVVMLNNDTEVTSGWLDEMVATFTHFDNVGMVGSKLIYPDGKLQEAGGIVWNTANPWNYGRGKNPLDPRYCYARQADYLSGASFMMPKKLWDEIGGFSEDYVPAYFEDTDLGFQVRDRGYKTVYAPLSIVVHFEGVSNGTSTSSGIKKYQEINRPKFKAKWSRACRDNGNEGVDLELMKDRNIQSRALVIDAEIPMADQSAGAYAAIQEIRLLQSLGFKCTFVPSNMAWLGKYADNLQRMGVEVVYAPFCGSVQEFLEKRGAEFELVYVTRYYVAKEYIHAIREYAPQAKVVLMNADLHFLREMRAAVYKKNAQELDQSYLTRDEELQTMRRVDLVLSYTDVEKSVIFSHDPSIKVAKCPWVVDICGTVQPFDARKDIAFLGGFGHKPNIEAVEWFLSNVWAQLSLKLPDAKFKIYGSKAPTSLIELTKQYKNVEVVGWVEHVNQVYDTCRVFIAPLQTGAGIKGKVVDALAHGIPTVMSTIAAEGIDVSSGENAFVADKASEWIDQVSKVYTDKVLWQNVSTSALKLADKTFGFASGVKTMESALAQCEVFTHQSENKTLAWKTQ